MAPCVAIAEKQAVTCIMLVPANGTCAGNHVHDGAIECRHAIEKVQCSQEVAGWFQNGAGHVSNEALVPGEWRCAVPYTIHALNAD